MRPRSTDVVRATANQAIGTPAAQLPQPAQIATPTPARKTGAPKNRLHPTAVTAGVVFLIKKDILA
jgi:hypothetical protein